MSPNSHYSPKVVSGCETLTYFSRLGAFVPNPPVTTRKSQDDNWGRTLFQSYRHWGTKTRIDSRKKFAWMHRVEGAVCLDHQPLRTSERTRNGARGGWASARGERCFPSSAIRRRRDRETHRQPHRWAERQTPANDQKQTTVCFGIGLWFYTSVEQ